VSPRHLAPAFTAALAICHLTAPIVRAQVVALPKEVVTATRTPQPPEQVAVALKSFDREALQAAPTVTLDGALRAVPGFSLFRRSDSLIANPTAQGVSLRGLGPSGASRSLVLLDGVPLNDPFGGWVLWSQAPREGLERIEVIPGGGASAWGNAALGGVVQLLTKSINSSSIGPSASKTDPSGAIVFSPFPTVLRGAHGVTAATYGDFGTRSFEFLATQPVGRGDLQLLGRIFATEGFSLVAPERRGSIDVDAWSRHRWLELRWRTPVTDALELTATARGFEEFRGNGTPYQRNGTREKLLSLALAGSTAKDFAWNAVAYGQDQSFASTFSSVNVTRTAETPASDQFAVPAVAWGASWTGVWQHADKSRTSAGLDGRYVRGETKENFTFTAGNFTRLRAAGGRQTTTGLFAMHERPLALGLHLTLGARLDRWDEADGHRRETDRTVGTVFRDDHYARLDGTEFSPSAGLVWQPAKNWRLRGSAQQAFRRPTLNELYRPFRQGANVTEANAALRTERVTTAELGIEWTPLGSGFAPSTDNHGFPTRGRPAPLKLGATGFWNDLEDAVGNVTLARGPGTFPIVGTLAAGGIGRQRLNLDRTRTQGLELNAEWSPSYSFSLSAAVLLNDANVRRASIAPVLVGKQVAQVPRRSATLGATWITPAKVTFTPRLRWIGRQFEDDENTLILGEVVVADLGINYAVTPHISLFLNAENLGNARVETGRSADGIVNIGTPRLVLGGVRGRW
jgi:outer membrane receptor protein involved in Fe transport